MKKPIVIAAAALGVIGSGYLGGTVFAASQDEGDSDTFAVAYTEDVPPFTRLKNGATAGEWRAETPLEDRPDFVRTRVDGRVGYLKLSDIDEGMVWPAPGEKPRVSTEDLEDRRRHVMVQPDENGEIWAPVYADDGVTAIGKQLMNPEADQRAP